MNVNEEIKSDRIRLIDENGEQRGIFMLRDALKIAAENGLDLVEVGGNNPPTCKIMDYGKYVYSKKKAQKNSHQQKNKEIKLSPNIDENDLNVKINKIRDIISSGDRVTVIMQFRGRMKMHKEIGIEKVHYIIEKLSDLTKMDGDIQNTNDVCTVSLVRSNK
jgi:translation initiation factor IF-3